VAGDAEEVVTVWITPLGDDFSSAVGRSVAIRLLPVGSVLPPFEVVAGFWFMPERPAAFEPVVFSTTCTDTSTGHCVQDPRGLATEWSWSFGDGTSSAGPTVVHAYARGGAYLATLRVGDEHGRVAAATQAVVVGEGSPPTAAFFVSPTSPHVGGHVFFNARESSSGPGRALERHRWDYGDGSAGVGVTTSHRYGLEGTYAVTLTVTDDTGVTASTTVELDVRPVGESSGGSDLRARTSESHLPER